VLAQLFFYFKKKKKRGSDAIVPKKINVAVCKVENRQKQKPNFCCQLGLESRLKQVKLLRAAAMWSGSNPVAPIFARPLCQPVLFSRFFNHRKKPQNMVLTRLFLL